MSESLIHISGSSIVWSQQPELVLQVPHMGAASPVYHLIGQSIACGARVPSVHPAMFELESALPNSYAHFPRLEEAVYPVMAAIELTTAQINSATLDALLGRSDLSPEQLNQLNAVLSPFTPIMSSSYYDLGLVNPALGVIHAIHTGAHAPAASKPYRHSEHERAFLRQEIHMLLEIKAIRRSTSPWRAPVILVKKSDGTLRMCLDYRKLNARTTRDSYPMPCVEDCLNAMSGCCFYTTLDLIGAFWQCPIAEEDIPKTAFSTPDGSFEWTRMPFGLVNAPATFQRLMDSVVADLPFAKAYQDDVVVASRSWEEHLAHITAVLQRLQDAGLKIKLSKCNFAAQSIRYLGFIVDREGVRPDPDKVQAITDLPAPRTLSELRSFLGMMGFFRHFIDKFASIAAPLFLLQRKNVAYVWSAACQRAFEQLKAALVAAPCLRLPDWSRPFILTTDWSKKAISAILSQEDPATGHEYAVAFASRALTAAESNYCASEGELLALVWATAKYRPYLHGRRFQARTDHKALEWLNEARFNNTKLERWALKLQEFDLDISYKQGVENVVADHLSRVIPAHTLALCLAEFEFDTTAAPPSHPMRRVAKCLTDACAARVQAVVPVCSGAPNVWPDQAQTASDYERVACTVCGDTRGEDNMCICDGCERAFHLRCLLPPQTTVPSGSWYCPGCDPTFANLSELCDPNTPLQYPAHDPYLDSALLEYVHGDHSDAHLPADARQARRLRHMGAAYRSHPSLVGWLLVYKKIRHGEHRWLVLPPLQYRWNIVRMVHDSLGHAGHGQTFAVMHQHFHWRNMHRDVHAFVQSCDACQKRKLVLPELPPLQEPAIYGPMRHTHVDLTGPFRVLSEDEAGKVVPMRKPRGAPPTNPVKRAEYDRQMLTAATAAEHQRKAWIVIMVDAFTKVAEFGVVYSKDPHVIARCFYDSWITRYGVPDFVTTDNGTEFELDFHHMLARMGTEHVHTSVAHPSANGNAERLVKTLKSMLVACVSDHPAHWLRMLPHVRSQYMHRVHHGTGFSPSQLLMGFQPRMPTAAGALTASMADLELSTPHAEYMDQLRFTLSHLDDATLHNLRSQFAANFKAYRSRAQLLRQAAQPPLKPGDLALEMRESTAALDLPATGPYQVVSIDPNGTVVLQSGATEFRDAAQFKRHVSNLARYYTPAEALALASRR